MVSVPHIPFEIPIGFAHRGARLQRRENTIDAFSRALELGATGLESDAWTTLDGVVVLDHDGAVGRLRRRSVGSLRRDELPAYIPSLGDLYRHCGAAFELSLDVKDPAALSGILAESSAFRAQSRLWLCHPDPATLGAWRAGAEAVHLVHSGRRPGSSAQWEERLSVLASAGVDAVNLPCRDWDEAGVGSARRHDLLVLGWDAHDTARLSRLLELGVDGVYSDRVELMMAAIGAARQRGA